MGGFISKSKLMDKKGDIAHFFKIEGYPLYGGTAPIFKPMLHHLAREEVGLIVTLLLEPLHSGRTINHRTNEFEDTEFADGDNGIEDTAKELGMECFHAPVSDYIGIPTTDVTNSVLVKVREFTKQKPYKKIYVHCWSGNRRTSLMLMILLRCVYHVSEEEAVKMLYDYNPKYEVQHYSNQVSFCWSDEFPALSKALYKEEYAPILLTPKDAKCYVYKAEETAMRDNHEDQPHCYEVSILGGFRCTLCDFYKNE